MAQLKLENVDIALEGENIVNDISFELEMGKIACLLGPSGCGKTTLLRAIAGFERPSRGEIILRDQKVADATMSLAPERRKVGMVFQELALFPHLTIAKNIAFGMRGQPKNVINERIDELLELVGLPDLRYAHPHRLSGGQQQRVALARAMAPRPDLLLLDEPFSSQDTERRAHLAREVGQILRQDNITALLVTHDQQEAFAMADYVGVMGKGRLMQWDSAYDLYHCPESREVADFIGQGVFVNGRVVSDEDLETDLGKVRGVFPETFPVGTEVELLIRPEDIIHDDHSPSYGVVMEKTFRGATYHYILRLPSGAEVFCIASSHHNHAIGEKIGIRLEMDHLVLFHKNSETVKP